jgi:hypothetical protein
VTILIMQEVNERQKESRRKKEIEIAGNWRR